jgi:hypothetical protein
VGRALSASVLTYFVLFNGPVIGPKYRLPMEPVLIVLAAISLAWLAKIWRREGYEVLRFAR